MSPLVIIFVTNTFTQKFMLGSSHSASFIIHQLLSLFSHDSLMQNFCLNRFLQLSPTLLSSLIFKMHRPLSDLGHRCLPTSALNPVSALHSSSERSPLTGDHSLVWFFHPLCSFRPSTDVFIALVSAFSSFFLCLESILPFPAQIGWGSSHEGIAFISCVVISPPPVEAVLCCWQSLDWQTG